MKYVSITGKSQFYKQNYLFPLVGDMLSLLEK